VITKNSSAIVIVPITTTKPTTVADSSAIIIDFPAVKAKKRPKARRRPKLSKHEELRRLRLGYLRRLLRDRCGPVLPDDDAGREYLKELLLPISLGPNEAVELWGPTDRMRCAIEVWAPWMSEDEARDLRIEINAMPRWERWPSQRTLGERLNVTYAERERLRLWGIDPCDMTSTAMALFRKRKKRQRDKLRRQLQGQQSRADYLANHRLSKEKPWMKEGISRATYYRRIKQEQARETSPRQTKLTTTELALVSKEELSTDAGLCVRPSTATHAEQTGTCVSDGFLTADEAAWLVGAL
jgi:hypothetical protein